MREKGEKQKAVQGKEEIEERERRGERRRGSLEVDYGRESGNNERNRGTKDEGDTGEGGEWRGEMR